MRVIPQIVRRKITEPKEDRHEETTSPWAFALGAGTELVVSVLAGYFLGQWLDGRLRTGPWLMLAGAVAGISVGLYQLIKAASERLGGGSQRR